jgi:hypothetical protein
MRLGLTIYACQCARVRWVSIARTHWAAVACAAGADIAVPEAVGLPPVLPLPAPPPFLCLPCLLRAAGGVTAAGRNGRRSRRRTSSRASTRPTMPSRSCLPAGAERAGGGVSAVVIESPCPGDRMHGDSITTQKCRCRRGLDQPLAFRRAQFLGASEERLAWLQHRRATSGDG